MQFSGNVAYTKEREWEQYLMPRTLEEALVLLEKFRGEARIIAGGTDLVVQSRSGSLRPRVLVDITRIPDLDHITLDRDTIRIGCLVTHASVVESLLIREKATALSEGSSRLGSPQIRNMGTVVGNIVNAQPGADTIIPLLVLDASVKVASREGERAIPLTELFMGVSKTSIDSSREIVTEVLFPALRPNEGSAALRLAKRKSLVLPILTVAVAISVDLGKKNFRFARIAAGPVALTPLRCVEAERLLSGNSINNDVIVEAAAAASRATNPRTSLIRGTKEYRQTMVAILVERALKYALERLEG
ncbi:MAG: xanthine dehydrogenase family protein subunit M [Deltaproteobacteria bacterium]|nr:xanthine dehydrogenase family protein subunit M [Deltaproteobacteria bacterium]